jgi:hypothetical protein
MEKNQVNKLNLYGLLSQIKVLFNFLRYWLFDPREELVCHQSNWQIYSDEIYAKLRPQLVHCGKLFQIKVKFLNFIVCFFKCPKCKSSYQFGLRVKYYDLLDSKTIHILQKYGQQVSQHFISLSSNLFPHLQMIQQKYLNFHDNISLD